MSLASSQTHRRNPTFQDCFAYLRTCDLDVSCLVWFGGCQRACTHGCVPCHPHPTSCYIAQDSLTHLKTRHLCFIQWKKQLVIFGQISSRTQTNSVDSRNLAVGQGKLCIGIVFQTKICKIYSASR